MAKRRRFSWLDLLIPIVLIALIAGVVVIYKKTNGFQKVDDFELNYDGQTLSPDYKMSLARDVDHRFSITRFFSTGDLTDYSVSVFANPDADFAFTVDELWYSWGNMGDVSSAFLLKKEASEFTIRIPAGCCVQKVLGTLFEGQSVSAPLDEELPSPYVYSLVVTSGNSSRRIDFAILWTDGMDIQLPDHIFF